MLLRELKIHPCYIDATMSKNDDLTGFNSSKVTRRFKSCFFKSKYRVDDFTNF